TLLETVREYALEHLHAHDETEATGRAHAIYFARVAEAAETHIRGPAQAEWLDQLEREHDNLRAALQWAAQYGEASLGVRLAGALWQFWMAHGHLTEGRLWLDKMLALSDSGGAISGGEHAGDTFASTLMPLRAKALNGAGVLASRQSDYARAI